MSSPHLSTGLHWSPQLGGQEGQRRMGQGRLQEQFKGEPSTLVKKRKKGSPSEETGKNGQRGRKEMGIV